MSKILSAYVYCIQYVSHQTPLQAEEVEILMVKEQLGANGSLSNLDTSADKLQTLDFQDTFAGLKVNDDSVIGGHLVSIHILFFFEIVYIYY